MIDFEDSYTGPSRWKTDEEKRSMDRALALLGIALVGFLIGFGVVLALAAFGKF